MGPSRRICVDNIFRGRYSQHIAVDEVLSKTYGQARIFYARSVLGFLAIFEPGGDHCVVCLDGSRMSLFLHIVFYILVFNCVVLGIAGSAGSQRLRYKISFLIFLFITVFVGVYVMRSDI